jgi:hypothetical protein
MESWLPPTWWRPERLQNARTLLHLTRKPHARIDSRSTYPSEADAEAQDHGRLGRVRLALLPYGKGRYVVQYATQ